MINGVAKKGYIKQIILGLSILIISCSTVACVKDGVKSVEEINNEVVETNLLEDIEGQISDNDKTFCVNWREKELTDEEWAELLKAFDELQKAETILPRDNGKKTEYISFTINGVTHEVAYTYGEIESYLTVDSQIEYNCTDAFLKIFERCCSENQETSIETGYVSPKERLIGLSIECDEPTSEEEYLNVARQVVAQWLDSLIDEEGEYRLESYTFTNRRVGDRVFQGDGYVNGGREFVCYVGFESEENDDTVFYEKGGYDTFYNYYFGPGVYARFRWENGKCTLIDYTSSSSLTSGSKLKDGLYGINEGRISYKTFYDFINDKENVDEWIGEGIYRMSYGLLLSHNVMMLSNGEVIYLDICADDEFLEEGENVTSKMSRYFYDSNGNSRYSSPVYFQDDVGAIVMTYCKDFPIIFDDYNHDGNPDYTIRIATDEYGSEYKVNCMDLRGTPWEDGGVVYLYGEFAESIRLQVSDTGKILMLDCDENGDLAYEEVALVNDISNTYHDDVTEDDSIDYRMYSQKFYLPEHLRAYGAEDKEIICYFWNNTEEKVTVGGQYQIERNNGEAWELVSGGKAIPSVEVEGRGCTELCFDISDINEEEIALYRVKIMANQKEVYGGFYLGSKAKANIDIIAEQYPTGINEISFTVTNTGMSAVYPDFVELYSGTKKIYAKDISDIGSINSNTSKTFTITCDDIGGKFLAGEYNIKVIVGEDEFDENVIIKEVLAERLFYFAKEVTSDKNVNGIVLSLKNNIWDEEVAKINYIDCVEVMRNGKWYDTPYMMNEKHAHYSFEEIEVQYGETVELEMEDESYVMKRMELIYDEIKSGAYDDVLSEEELSQFKEMTFEEYARDVMNVVVPEKGELCRVNIHISGSNGEYVYFYMP